MTNPAVVLDNGSYSTRIGFSNAALPHSIFRSLVAPSEDGVLIGDAAKGKGTTKKVFDLYFYNTGNVEKLWNYAFEKANVRPEEHTVLLDNPYCPITKADKESMAQILFENFNIPAMHLNDQAVLTLHSYGRLTGLVLQSGFLETQNYPVYEGHILSNSMQRGLYNAGQYLTYTLMDHFEKQGRKCDMETANNIKETTFYIAEDYKSESVVEETFTLPDKTVVTLGREKFCIPEELFTSDQFGVVQELIFSTVHHCPSELRQELFQNIILSGGNTLLPGFAQRLHTELEKLCGNRKNFNIAISTPENPVLSAWIGGTILASLSTFPDMCMTKDEYNEYGPTFVHRKFF